MNLLTCFYTFMTAMFAALIVVPFLCKWALEQGNVDHPDARKVHETPMPRLGGIAIFLSFLLSVIVYVPVTTEVRGFLAGGLIIFITGLVDDLTDLSAKRKFLGQVAACLTTITLGDLWLVNLGDLFGFGTIILPAWLGIPFTLFAVVGVINAINLIDGLDGLAGGVSVLALMAFFVLSWLANDSQGALLAAALAGGLLGFLKYNFYPARIFMGDAGSLTVGFLLGFMSVYITQRPHAQFSPMLPVLILALPLLDTIWVMTRRFLQRASLFAADRSHVHHKFLDLGFEHRFTVIIIYSLSLFWNCSALIMRTQPEYFLLLFLVGTASIFYFGLRYVLRNPEQFHFALRDAKSDIRSSVTYLRVAKLVDHAVPFLLYLLIGYLALAAWSVVIHDTLSWQLAAVLLCSGIFLWYRPFTENRHFLMLVLYVVVGMASMEIWHANEELIAGLSVKRCGDILLVAGSVIVILKIQFRHIGEFFLSTADYLTLAICIFLSIAAQHNALGFNLNGVMLRTMIAILILRTLCSRDILCCRRGIWSLFVFLSLVVVFGLIN